jgi:general secretion pathway protein C
MGCVGVQKLIANHRRMPLALAVAETLGWSVAGIVLARAIWLPVTPAGPLGTPPPSPPLRSATATASPLALAGSDPFFPQGTAAPDAVSGLDLALVGTRVDAASARGSAIIATPDGRQQSFAVGDEIMPGVKLVAVEFESVVLDRGGARETLYIDQSPSDAAAPTTQPAVQVAPPPLQAPPATPTGAQAK